MKDDFTLGSIDDDFTIGSRNNEHVKVRKQGEQYFEMIKRAKEMHKTLGEFIEAEEGKLKELVEKRERQNQLRLCLSRYHNPKCSSCFEYKTNGLDNCILVRQSPGYCGRAGLEMNPGVKEGKYQIKALARWN